MYYTNETDLTKLTTIQDMIEVMQSNNIRKNFEIVEFMAIPRNIILPKILIENFSSEHNIEIKVQDKLFNVKVITSYRNQPYTNGSFKIIKNTSTVPNIGGSLQRKNTKKGLESIRLNRKDLDNSTIYKSIVEAHKELIILKEREAIAKQLIEVRTMNVIQEDRRIALSLQFEYENINKSEELDFFKKHNFVGMENLNVYSETDDGYGHKKGITTQIDWENKSIYTTGFSSDG